MRPTTPSQEATPEEIHRRRESGEDLLLIDVREQEEIAIAALPGGIRSMHVAMALADRGGPGLRACRRASARRAAWKGGGRPEGLPPLGYQNDAGVPRY